MTFPRLLLSILAVVAIWLILQFRGVYLPRRKRYVGASTQ
jgi:hypothetical protein